jgi:hypothetical protein
MPNKDAGILRGLAFQYRELAESGKNGDNIKLHKSVNDLKMLRPAVLLDELPWHEMNFDGSLSLMCEDADFRAVENFFRKYIYRAKYFYADMVLPRYVPVRKIINSTGNGIEINEETRSENPDNRIVSHEYHDILATGDDLAKLRAPEITYDETETMRIYNKTGGAIGDILPIRLTGIQHSYIATWDDVAMYRGITNLLIDLVERPEFMHKIARKITDIKLSELEQYEKLGLLDDIQVDLHCTCAATDDLPKVENGRVTRKNIWGRGMAQPFVSASKAMREEFDIEYMKEIIGTHGLAYYGCCEPLDKMIDIVEKIPNIRKIGVTPWADKEVACEAIGKKYVVAAKPNPAAVAVGVLNKDELKAELNVILSAVKKNGCSCDIVLKDISTCGGRPENIFEWTRTAMDLVRNF